MAGWVQVWGNAGQGLSVLFLCPRLLWTESLREQLFLHFDLAGVIEPGIKYLDMPASAMPLYLRSGQIVDTVPLPAEVPVEVAHKGSLFLWNLARRRYEEYVIAQSLRGETPMIPVWLYGSDGRQLYYVYVQTPQPIAVTYAGRVFYWNSQTQRYEEAPRPLMGIAPAEAQEAHTEGN